MSVVASYDFKLSVSETLTADVDAVASPTLAHSFGDTGTLKATTTPAATSQVAVTIPLVAGAKTLDLTALSGTNGATVSGTGLSVQVLKLVNKGSHAMTFAKGASSGYALTGSAWTETIPAGGKYMMNFNGGANTIGSGAKNIDVTGTGTESFNLHVVLG